MKDIVDTQASPVKSANLIKRIRNHTLRMKYKLQRWNNLLILHHVT